MPTNRTTNRKRTVTAASRTAERPITPFDLARKDEVLGRGAASQPVLTHPTKPTDRMADGLRWTEAG